MNVLGVNALHGDASAVLLCDGHLVAAAEEERFSRVKHAAGMPTTAMRSCLEIGGLRARDIDVFAVSRDPRAHRFRKALFLLRSRPHWRSLVDRASNAARMLDIAAGIGAALDDPATTVRSKLRWVEHHPAHLASAFFPSSFEWAAVCAIDGFGDFVSTSAAIGRGIDLDVTNRTYFPHSLGLLYLAITQWLGFWRYGDEFKVMGLAPYGEPRYASRLRSLIRLLPDGQFKLDLRYFRHWSDGVAMTWDAGEPVIGRVFTSRLEDLLGPARRAEDRLNPEHEAVAASLQVVFEEVVVHILRALHARSRADALCLAGGCAMNSVMNGKIREATPFRHLYIQPAAGDNGTALGAALYVQHALLRRPRVFRMDHGYWGPAFDEAHVEGSLSARRLELASRGDRVQVIDDEQALCDAVAARIAGGAVVGWFQGRMEWGARALGNRSILADPRRADMRDVINLRIKFREKFRPFAPSILEEALDEYFVGAVPDPFMVQVYPVRPEKRSVIPAVTHVDGSGRLQTVSEAANPLYWRLIKAFEKQTGVAVLLNTSFNENEPIVHRPEEALDCFLRTQMDVLVLGRTVVSKRSA